MKHPCVEDWAFRNGRRSAVAEADLVIAVAQEDAVAGASRAIEPSSSRSA